MLSRIPDNPTAKTISVGVIQNKFKVNYSDEQLVDKLYCKIIRIELLKEKTWAEALLFLEGGSILTKNSKLENICTENSVLYHTSIDEKQKKLTKCLIIPQTLIPAAIQLSHNTKINAHAGVLITYFRSRYLFYFQNQLSLIRKYISSCILCQKRKLPSHPNCV